MNIIYNILNRILGDSKSSQTDDTSFINFCLKVNTVSVKRPKTFLAWVKYHRLKNKIYIKIGDTK